MTEKKKQKILVVTDDYADIDKLGYEEHTQALVEMIKAVDGTGSFTIGIHGEWGRGKTSILRQIEHKLKKEKEILTVWFNPWQFIAEKHIIIPYFQTVVQVIREYTKDLEDKGKVIPEKIKKFCDLFSKVPQAILYGVEAEMNIPLLFKGKFKFKDMFEEAKKLGGGKKGKLITEYEKTAEEYESIYYNMISKLKDVSKDLGIKIVVFIDDLDRCLPEKAVALLEGIKVLLDIPSFINVIGVSRDVIEQGIAFRYRDFNTGNNSNSNNNVINQNNRKFIYLKEKYLDKIIQFPFLLPPPEDLKLMKLIEDYLKNLPEEMRVYKDVIYEVLGNNPRELKRFITNLSFTCCVANKKKTVVFLPELLVKMALLSHRFSKLYNSIGKTPYYLITIEELIEKNKDGDKKNEKKGSESEIWKTDVEIDDFDLFNYHNKQSILGILKIREGQNGFKITERVKEYMSLFLTTGVKSKKKVDLLEDESKVSDSNKFSNVTQADKTGAEFDDKFKSMMKRRMIEIPAGSLDIKNCSGRLLFKGTVNKILVDKYPVTQELYEWVMGPENNVSHFQGKLRPVEKVSWFDAINFCNEISKKSNLDNVYNINDKNVTVDWHKNGFRLLTEVEWEYACRAGTTKERYGKLEEIAWYVDNSNLETKNIGEKEPNGFGLHDMLGNVWEWCWDWYEDYPDMKKGEFLWRGPEIGTGRVLRGGGWDYDAENCRSSYRSNNSPVSRRGSVGFRLARSL